jgi:hypothetical protein
MKKIILYICILGIQITKAQNIIFTDNTFKNVLVSILPSHNKAFNLQNQSVRIDTNQDGEIQINEAQNIKFLNIDNSNITNLSGLEHFTKMKFLNLTANLVSQFNFPSLIDLEYLSASNNQISSINLSYYSKLYSIGIDNNPIAQVDVSTLPLLNYINCSHSQITTLDFRNNPNLTLFSCKNSGVTTIYFHPNTQLNLTTNSGVLNDCWANNPLTYICAGASQITPITTFLTNCGHNLSNITINITCALNVNNYDKELVKIFPNPSTTGIFTIKLPNVHTGEGGF